MAASALSATGRIGLRVAALLFVLVVATGPFSANKSSRAAQTAFALAPIELPVEGTSATLPLHLLAHVGQPGERVHAVLSWQNGIELDRSFTLIAGEVGGQGLLAANLDWDQGTQPALPTSQTAVLDLSDDAGKILGHRQLTILGPDNTGLGTITLYFVINGDTVTPVQRRIPSTPRIATATVNELLWGPAPGDRPNLTTALPRPEDVLDYPGRKSDWGERVQLRGVNIVDGVATADLSREFGAYGGGSLRVGLIDQQISRTLEQFPSVRRVSIAIEGDTGGVLQP
jgi:hypothetical protein